MTNQKSGCRRKWESESLHSSLSLIRNSLLRLSLSGNVGEIQGKVLSGSLHREEITYDIFTTT
jgi:hypothetical protein